VVDKPTKAASAGEETRPPLEMKVENAKEGAKKSKDVRFEQQDIFGKHVTGEELERQQAKKLLKDRMVETKGGAADVSDLELFNGYPPDLFEDFQRHVAGEEKPEAPAPEEIGDADRAELMKANNIKEADLEKGILKEHGETKSERLQRSICSHSGGGYELGSED